MKQVDSHGRVVTACRMCHGGNLHQFLDLGFTPLVDRFITREELAVPEVHYPLRVYMCLDCGLAQLDYVVRPEVLYQHDYPYESNITSTGRQHFLELAKTVSRRLGLGRDDLVLDIGSNVGLLLEGFKNQGAKVLGIDPAATVAAKANACGIETIVDFFNCDKAEQIAARYPPVSVVTATNVFAHVDDLEDFVKGLDRILKPNGIFVFEVPYLLNLLRYQQYDTIYHEHLSYVAVTPVVRFFRTQGLEVFDIQQVAMHGGSLRVFVARAGCMPIDKVVSELVEQESQFGLRSPEVLARFAQSVEKNRSDLLWLLRKLKHNGKKLVAVSAPAKGMTLLNYCRIGVETLDYITEKSALKIGRLTPGGHIPVAPDSCLETDPPDYALLLAWNFAKEIQANLRHFTDGGGRFIVPVPAPYVTPRRRSKCL